ncbi:hypothetical protein [Meiothermus ruber]|jgi:hypothetical protein|uniref:Uncharacterized protein n=1 Tax=Meiothermus ruber (strain ATCC 35948 / DSM 1279 / VKM B-1258 / 21) TaxID=504728 RepID=A0A806D5F5_MEIRD|nr:hypothetical protein [Meiothermus ruber]ADD26966.1 hypothetical protein Mrub_0186 [Meiothermus ruber DSM 1279]MCL6530805.1 hypothetical protein [Meiothermus ruber]GAO73883.1 putative uncharacterized protein [Meiothermus ruber H328]
MTAPRPSIESPAFSNLKADLAANPPKVRKTIDYYRQQIALEARERHKLNQQSFELYSHLLNAALLWLGHKRLSTLPKQVTLHAPLEQVALDFGVHRHTIKHWLRPLVQAGLVVYRPQKVTAWGRTCHTGTVWFVSLDPTRKARLIWSDMKETYRNLEQDKANGKLSYTVIRHTKESGQLGLDAGLLNWAIPSRSIQPENNLYVENSSSTVEVLFEVEFASRKEVGEVVERAARAILAALGDDPRRFGGWCWLLWQARRLADVGQSIFTRLYEQIRRGMDARERGRLNNPAAYTRHLLDETGLLDMLRNAPVRRWPTWEGGHEHLPAKSRLADAIRHSYRSAAVHRPRAPHQHPPPHPQRLPTGS